MPQPKQRIIMHVDMDAFFVSVEQRERPELAGKPVVVGADPKHGHGRGVISTASYEARAFGIHSGMPISIAWRKCPGEPSGPCIYLPVNFRLYEEVSEKIMAIIRKYADAFELGGIDECYLDVSKRAKDFDGAAKLAKKIKAEIEETEHLSCSVGIAPNKLVAKIASDFQKPDGLTVVGPAAVSRFLGKLDVRKLHGVGPKTETALKERDVQTIAQLKQVPKFALIEWFGRSFGEYLYRSSHGVDESPLIEHWESKSIGREWTYEHDTTDKKLILKTIEDLAKEILEQFQAENFKTFKTVTVKIRYQGFETHTHQQTLKEPSSSLKDIVETSHKLVEPYLGERKIRLIGTRISHLEKS